MPHDRAATALRTALVGAALLLALAGCSPAPTTVAPPSPAPTATVTADPDDPAVVRATGVPALVRSRDRPGGGPGRAR